MTHLRESGEPEVLCECWVVAKVLTKLLLLLRLLLLLLLATVEKCCSYYDFAKYYQ